MVIFFNQEEPNGIKCLLSIQELDSSSLIFWKKYGSDMHPKLKREEKKKTANLRRKIDKKNFINV